MRSGFSKIKFFLLSNQTTKQTIFKNTFWLGLGEGVSKLLSFLLFIYIARILGPLEYGKFSFALAFIGLFTFIANFGLPRVLVREISQDPDKERDFPPLFALRIALSFLSLALIAFFSFFVTDDYFLRKVIWILAVYTLLEGTRGFLIFFFQAKQKMEYESFLRVLRSLLLVGIGLVVLFKFPSVENLSYAYLLVSFLLLIIGLIIFSKKYFFLRPKIDLKIWKKYLLMSWPLGLSAFFAGIYGQIDSVMLGYIKQLAQAGWYNASYRLVGVLMVPLSLVSTSFYPSLNNAFRESEETFKKIWSYYKKLMFGFAFFLVLGGIILAPWIINFFYGSKYQPAVLAFQILIFMLGFSFLQQPFLQALLVFKQEKKIFWVNFGGGLANLIFNLILIPKFSLYGAAVSMVISSIFMFLISFLFVYLYGKNKSKKNN